ncbi:MAG: hypothetical protein V7785_13575 [Bermanella sp.]
MNTAIFVYITAFVFLLSLGFTSQAADYYVELDVSSGYNNNVFLESDDTVINQETEDSDKQDIQNQLSLMGSYEFFDGQDSDAKIMLDYFKESLLDNSLDTTVTSLSIPFTYYINDYRLRSSAGIMNYNLDGVHVLDYQSGRFDVTRKVGDNSQGDKRLGAQISYTQKIPQDESYDAYDGTTQSLKLHYTVTDLATMFKLDGNVFENDYLLEEDGSQGYYLKAIYSKRFVKSGMRLLAKYKKTNYNLGLLDDEVRNDDQFTLSYTQEYFLNNIIQLYLSTEFIENNSSIETDEENYNYSQWTNTMGARFSF